MRQPEGALPHLAGALDAAEVSGGQVGSHGDVVLAHDHPAVLQQRQPGEAHWERTPVSRRFHAHAKVGRGHGALP